MGESDESKCAPASHGNWARLRRKLVSEGFASLPKVIGEAHRDRLLQQLRPERLQTASRHRSGIVFGARHLLATIPGLRTELTACGVDALASLLLERDAFPIDAAYFDKQCVANWAVPVHQDRVLPVAPDGARKNRATKGVFVAEPTASSLAQLLALRIHFDPTDGETGALFVMPGSHSSGVLKPDQIQAIPLTSFVPCVADVGDVISMRPLLLHRSPPSKGLGQRRVLHVVYATEQPDDGLRWRATLA